MGEFKLQLGGTVDVASSKELDDAVTGLQGHIDRKFANSHKPRMTVRTLAASTFQSFAGGSVQMVLEPRTPSAGKVWIVRRVTVTGADDFTKVSASLNAAIYVGDPFNFTLGQLIAPGQAMPFVNFFTNKGVYVYDKEVLFISFNSTGVVNFQNLSASAMVEEWDVDALMRLSE